MKSFFTYTVFSLCLLNSFTTLAQGSNGLIAHWNMNGNANDITGHGHNGNIFNVTPATGINGVANTAYYFNGSNSYISSAYKSDLNISKYTICATVKATGYYSGTCQGNWIFGRGDFSAVTHVGAYGIGYSDNAYNSCSVLDTTLETINCGAGTNTLVSATPWAYTPHFTSYNWHHVVVVYDSTKWKVYLDHNLVYTVASTSNPIGTSTDSISIGQNTHNASYPYNFKGYMDDLMLYGVALTDSQAIHYGDTCGRISLQPSSVVSKVGNTTVFQVNTAMVAATYQWQQDSGSGFTNLTNTVPYSGVTTNSLTISGVSLGLSGSRYRCILNNTWVCTDTSASATLTVSEVGVQKLTSQDIVTVFPNPSDGNIYVWMPTNVDIAHLEILNGIGQRIVENEFTGSKHNVDISKYPSGIYTLKISGDGFSVAKKLIKN